MKYRADIDGLRAVAVIAVFLHHINSGFLPGGFIGVDIFFVISGFLITTQIVNQLEADSFSLKEFYKRRLNRIVPALSAVSFVTVLAGGFILSPVDLILLTKSALASVFGVSNIFFWQEYGSYFASNSTEAPLLHTWSLGVEEQFYLLWPVLLLVLYRWFRSYLVVLLVLAFIASLLVSELGSRVAVSAAYYLMPTRFFELMFGGLLYIFVRRFPPSNEIYSVICFVIGITVLSGSLYWIKTTSSFPGFTALWPCLGAALIIWSGEKATKFHRILIFKPIVFVGLLSYSLYLWHWPVISYLNYIGVYIDVLMGGVIFLCVLFISWLSWRYIEIPLRQGGAGISFGAVVVTRLALPVAFFAAVSAVAINTKGIPARFSDEVATLESAQNFKPNELRAGCHVPTVMYKTKLSDTCRIGADKELADGVLIGDSFANHFTGMLDVLAKDEELSLIDYTMDACPPIRGFDNGLQKDYSSKCIHRNEQAYRYIENNSYKYVVLASAWPDTEAAASLLDKSIQQILEAGSQVVIILSNGGAKGADTCSIRNAMYGRKRDCGFAEIQQVPYIDSLREKYPDINFIDPNSVLCDSGICQTVVNGVLVYRDSSHLNDVGSRLIGQELLRLGITLVAN